MTRGESRDIFGFVMDSYSQKFFKFYFAAAFFQIVLLVFCVNYLQFFMHDTINGNSPLRKNEAEFGHCFVFRDYNGFFLDLKTNFKKVQTNSCVLPSIVIIFAVWLQGPTIHCTKLPQEV